VKKAPRAAAGKRRKSQLTGGVCEDVQENGTCGGGAAPLPEPPSRRTATGSLVQLCDPAPAAPPIPEVKSTAPPEPARDRFSEAYTYGEIAESLEILAGERLADVQLLLAHAAELLHIVAVAQVAAVKFRALDAGEER
jgi:hypothetical protein